MKIKVNLKEVFMREKLYDFLLFCILFWNYLVFINEGIELKINSFLKIRLYLGGEPTFYGRIFALLTSFISYLFINIKNV